MRIINKVADVRAAICEARAAGKSIGFVPTMGALHAGHRSLIERSVSENGLTLVSIFVNPLQFGQGEDFDAYPRTIESDSMVCAEAGADIIFVPGASEMYPEGFSTGIHMSGPCDVLCGASRPDHFGGVMTIVAKLFNIVKPDHAYFGEKDAQQLAVVRKMVRDLNMDVEVVGCPTVREADGLAISSRNVYLSETERRAAAVLHRALAAAEDMASGGVGVTVPGRPRSVEQSGGVGAGVRLCEKPCHPEFAARQSSGSGWRDVADADPSPRGECQHDEMRCFHTVGAEAIFVEVSRILSEEPLAAIEYVELLDADTFGSVTDKTERALLAIATHIGSTRLIDNVVIPWK